MYARIEAPSPEHVTIYFEDRAISVAAGITVAAAVLEPAKAWVRTSHTGRKHGPYCHMGVCHECLMTIDGVPNQQACLITVREGMRVSRQNGAPDFSPPANQETGNGEGRHV